MNTKKGKAFHLKAFVAMLIAAMIVAIPAIAAPQNAEAATIVTATVKPTYSQTEARSQLTLINNYRASKPGYTDQNGKTSYTNTYTKKLVYDYTLEKLAMQRAAELIFRFDHTRPRGDSRKDLTGYVGIGENISASTNAGAKSASYSMNQFKEDGKDYDHQGHRRIMLGNFDAVGVACVYYKGAYFWVQEFGMTSSPDTVKTTAVDVEKTMSVDIDDSYISYRTQKDNPGTAQTSFTLKVGDKITLTNDVTVDFGLDKDGNDVTWPRGHMEVSGTWKSDNTNIVKIAKDGDSSILQGMKAGSANINFTGENGKVLKSINIKVIGNNKVGWYYENGLWIYYNTDSKVDTSKTGLYKNPESTWVYLNKGKQDKSFIGISASTASPTGKFPVRNGIWDSSYTGLAYSKSDETWYYFANGRYNTTYVGTSVSTAVPDGKFPVKNGKWDKTYTGLAYSKYDNTWYYFSNGRYNTTYEGLSLSTANAKTIFYVKKGKWQNTYTGKIIINNISYSIKNGKVQ